jgi:hypothetical protein
MFKLRHRSARLAVTASVLATGLGALALANGAPAAHADPATYKSANNTPYVGVGSDTVQDVFNAFSGQEPSAGIQPSNISTKLASVFYTPLHTDATDAKHPSEVVTSFDALDPHLPAPTTNTQTISPVAGGATFDRPNGSGDGRAALDASLHAGATFARSSQPGTPEPTAGLVSFARSSSKSGTAGSTPTGDMSLIPFASDGLGYAFHCANPGTADCTALQSLSTSTFHALYANTGTLGNGNGQLAPTNGGWTGTNQLESCAIQTGSGTFKTFLNDIGFTASTATTDAQTSLTVSGVGSLCTALEENNLSSFLSTATGLSATADWIIPTSMGNDIAQHNGVALNRSAATGFVFFATNGAFTTGNGIAGPTDAWSTSSTTAVTAGTAGTTISIGLKPVVGATLTLAPTFGGSPNENVTVSSVTGTDPYTVGITGGGVGGGTVNSYVAGFNVSMAISLTANFTGSTWTANDVYYGSNFGRWLFVVVPSASITSGLTLDQGMADLFYTPLATTSATNPSHIAAICQSSTQTTIGNFGFDPALPDNGTAGEQNGTCGTVAFSNASS